MKDLMGDLLSAAGAEVSVIPVVQGDGMPKVDVSQLPDMIPILALRNAVLFPGTVFPITIGREMSIRLIEDAEKNNMFIGAVPQNDLSVEEPQMEDLYPYGTVAKIIKTLEMPDGTITAILQGYQRFKLEAVVQYEPYMLGRVHYIEDIVPADDANTKMIAETLKEKAAAVIRSSSMAPREAVSALKGIDNFEFLVNFVATTI
ncbi:MAG: LON peptidase substrate-binding domain-containing protein, partial [Bacteroidales bacterium]|nr:LON peptidase substrate-binding domain-containing protein [Bacteroidales bacterium]